MKVYGRRFLLNGEGNHSTAAIVAELIQTDYGWEPRVVISDCTRTISLSFPNPLSATDDEWVDSMEKIYKIKLALSEFEKGMRKVRRTSR